MSVLPAGNILPDMTTNEAIRRLGFVFLDANGNPQVGAPNGPLVGAFTLQTRVVAGGPSPATANLLVSARLNRRGMTITNLDDTNTIWFDSNPNVTDQQFGKTLFPLREAVFQWSGAVYVYCISGSPMVEAYEIYG